MIRERLKKLNESTAIENRKVILSLLDSDKSAKVLDLGCGDGSFTLELGRRIGTSELHCVEVVEEFISSCEGEKGIKAYQSDLNEPLPLDDESFDVVHANQVFEHLHHTDLFIREIHRVLKSRGYAIISTPNLAAWHNVACLFLGWQPFSASLSDKINVGNPLHTTYKMKAAGGKYPVHRRIPTYRGLKELFQYHGFKVEKIVGVGYYPFPTKIAKFFSKISPKHSVILTMKVKKEQY